MTDDIDTRRRRAAYRASHRGTREMDVMIGGYAQAALGNMDDGALDMFEQFLALPDPVLSGWLSSVACGSSEFALLVEAVRRFHGLSAEAGEPGQI